MSVRSTVNERLDAVVRPHIDLLRHRWSAFHVCGCTGILVALLLASFLAIEAGLALAVVGLLLLCGSLTFFALAMVTKLITGEEQLIYYHHEIAVLATSALLLWILDLPVLAYLDLTILGIGAFLACGRIGCLMVGCCHGKPSGWGVCYSHDHARAGFTPYYVGVRLFPIQFIEALWVLLVVIVGSLMVAGSAPAGSALAWYVVAYDIGRFCFEFFRGDPERPYYLGFSEAQWISLVLMMIISGLELAGAIVITPWHIGVTALMAIAVIVMGMARKLDGSGRHRILHPHHVRELSEAMGGLTLTEEGLTEEGLPAVGTTSLGIHISLGTIENGRGRGYHYALSCGGGWMTEECAKILSGLIRQLRHPAGEEVLTSGEHGVYHLIIYPPRP